MSGYKSKTLAAWIALLAGSFGLHRFYLHGLRDLWGWLHPWPTLLGIWGLLRMQQLGQDDRLAWALIPLAGLMVAQGALWAILYGLMPDERWNARFNPDAPSDAEAGGTRWATIFAIIIALMVGAGVLMASFAFSFQRYFEYQVEEGRRISQ